MIELRELTKRYGGVTAVDGLTCTVRPGRVTGFLGPNGAGKSTAMRLVLGLDRPTSGEALVNGRRYAAIDRPLHEVGALLDAGAVHPGRTAAGHLGWLARSNRIAGSRATALLERVGLAAAADRRVGGFSLGMRQRLGVAAALLGDPGVLLLDEPVNGLDPEGIRWIRELMRSLAAEGRTVLVSSHLMSEMALTADHILVAGRGRLIAEATTAELTARFQRDVAVRTPRPDLLAPVLERAGAAVVRDGDELAVTGLDAAAIGELSLAAGVAVHGLAPRGASLEEAFLSLTGGSVEYRGAGPVVAEQGVADHELADHGGAHR